MLQASVPHSQRLARRLENSLADAFRRGGWEVQVAALLSESPFRPDLCVSKGRLRYVIALKIAREPRRPIVQAMFADAVLQAQAAARELKAQPLAIVAAPLISPGLAAELVEYANHFAPDISWGLLDAEGRLDLHGPKLDGIRVESPRPPLRHAPIAKGRVDPFSDLGQWMLKVLLADGLASKFLGAPRGPVRNAADLAQLASVSLPSAFRFVAQLRHGGFMDSEGGRLRLVRVQELLQSWRIANSSVSIEIPARWLIPPKDSYAQLKRVLADNVRPSMLRHQGHSIPQVVTGGESARLRKFPAQQKELGGSQVYLGGNGPRACLGLFAASDALGFRFASGAPLHFYLEDLSRQSLDQFGLVPADRGEAVDVFVRRPRFPEAVFRAVVIRDQVPAADLLQCWMDISSHPARGQEHAEQIWRRVILPRLVKMASP